MRSEYDFSRGIVFAFAAPTRNCLNKSTNGDHVKWKIMPEELSVEGVLGKTRSSSGETRLDPTKTANATQSINRQPVPRDADPPSYR
jgi:hypothetical protein